jgi:hypothetical protein
MIEVWIRELLQLTDEEWSRYAFLSEPLANRISQEQRTEFSQKTTRSAVNLAQEIRRQFGNISPEMMVRKLSLNLIEKNVQEGGGFSMFACFEDPNTITIFRDNADATDKLIDEKGLREVVGDIKTVDLLIAHELYHFLEFTRIDVYSASKRIKVWQIGPFKNISRIKCLGEIGAMAFTRELLKLPYCPNVFNVLMLYTQNPVSAERLFVKTLKLKNI